MAKRLVLLEMWCERIPPTCILPCISMPKVPSAQQTALVAGVIFAATKLSLTAWFFAVFCVTQVKERIAALNLRPFLGNSDCAALRMQHKVQLVMKKDDDNLKLAAQSKPSRQRQSRLAEDWSQPELLLKNPVVLQQQ